MKRKSPLFQFFQYIAKEAFPTLSDYHIVKTIKSKNSKSRPKNNAFQAGYRCGYVYIAFPEYAHAIVCFNTTDNDLIFIEPQSDDVVTLTIGEPYWDRTIYEPPDYDDTIVSFTIIW